MIGLDRRELGSAGSADVVYPAAPWGERTSVGDVVGGRDGARDRGQLAELPVDRGLGQQQPQRVRVQGLTLERLGFPDLQHGPRVEDVDTVARRERDAEG